MLTLCFSSCSTAENVSSPVESVQDTTKSPQSGNDGSEDVPSHMQENVAENYRDPASYSFYERYHSKMSDLYTTRQNTIPAAFLIEEEPDEDTEAERDPFQGFRVQIYTARDVLDADTTAALFRTWADTTISGYQADTYIFFKPPYYRIHVGDFHDRERAQTYARLIKRRFRSAWVVYDRVNPLKVPADSVSFSLIN
jgi:hypothetical protein